MDLVSRLREVAKEPGAPTLKTMIIEEAADALTRLLGAVEPFADYADDADEAGLKDADKISVYVNHVRRARSALAQAVQSIKDGEG